MFYTNVCVCAPAGVLDKEVKRNNKLCRSYEPRPQSGTSVCKIRIMPLAIALPYPFWV